MYNKDFIRVAINVAANSNFNALCYDQSTKTSTKSIFYLLKQILVKSKTNYNKISEIQNYRKHLRQKKSICHDEGSNSTQEELRESCASLNLSETKCQKYFEMAKWRPMKVPEAIADNITDTIEELPPSIQIHSDRFFYMAGDDGKAHLVDVEVAPYLHNAIHCFRKNYNNMKYLLYTRQNHNSPHYLKYDDVSSIKESFYEKSKVTVFICHGWLGNYDSSVNSLLTNAFLDDADVNVIVIDWSLLSSTFYPTAKASVATVGSILGQFINWMVDNKLMRYNKIHLVGHSLGGHLVGFAGRKTLGKVKRVTALDPAGPLWYSDKSRLNSTDALYVEVIHTNTHLYGGLSGWALGYRDPCGDADFYPNGGRMMPGCWFDTCSHSKAYEYMAASVEFNRFKAYRCANYEEVTDNVCKGNISYMGNSELSKKGRGLFRVNTKSTFPF